MILNSVGQAKKHDPVVHLGFRDGTSIKFLQPISQKKVGQVPCYLKYHVGLCVGYNILIGPIPFTTMHNYMCYIFVVGILCCNASISFFWWSLLYLFRLPKILQQNLCKLQPSCNSSLLVTHKERCKFKHYMLTK